MPNETLFAGGHNDSRCWDTVQTSKHNFQDYFPGHWIGGSAALLEYLLSLINCVRAPYVDDDMAHNQIATTFYAS